MTSLPPLRSTLIPKLIVSGAPTKSIAAAAPPPVACMTCLTASRAALSIVSTAPICRACPLLRVEIGDDDFPCDNRRRNMDGAAADPAGADDDEMVVRADMV